MSYNLTDEINRWRGDDTPLTSKVNLVPIKRVFKVKSHFAAEKASSLSPKSVAIMKKPPINPYVDTINRDYQKNIAKLMIGGYLNTEKMNSVYNSNMEKALIKSVWKHRPSSSNNYNNSNIPFTDPTKKSNANKIFNLDSPNTMKNIGGMMDEEEAEALLHNEKLISNVQEMNDKYDEIMEKTKIKNSIPKKKDSKVKKRIEDRLIRKEDAPTKEELEQQEKMEDTLKKPNFFDSMEPLDYSHITKSSTDIHDIMEKYDYIKYLQNKHVDKNFIPSSPSSAKLNNDDVVVEDEKKSPSSSPTLPSIKIKIDSENLEDKNVAKPDNEKSLITKIKSQPTMSTPHVSFITSSYSDNILSSNNSKCIKKTEEPNAKIVLPISSPKTSQSTPNVVTDTSSSPSSPSSSSPTKIKKKEEEEEKEKEKDKENENENNKKEENKNKDENNTIDDHSVSIYKPTLPQFKSKLYNQGDISLQEKILSLENSKKYGVNENSQKFKNFYKNDKTEKFENYINKKIYF
ncbi:hypothetical protein PIROE2DRAFT_9998 [Piromyces sp. E2]|nr:hypothetical protein PIROE2DRAFT_9998 [Piromyces sp. E2]|eukprot:OUM63453.1 hypothetical protein PIROE2DRAFT_9998 [Piromyces sp. E2]